MQLELLKELGLSDGEIKVYSAILHIGISSVNKIHEKTKTSFQTDYSGQGFTEKGLREQLASQANLKSVSLLNPGTIYQ